MSTAPELRARLAANEAEHALLVRQLDDEYLRIYATAVQGRAFSAVELWRHQAVHRELREVFVAARIRSPQQLGKQLKRFARGAYAGWQLERVGADNAGAIWVVRVSDDSHLAPCPLASSRI